MHDIKTIRTNPQDFDNAMLRRGLQPISVDVLELDKNKRKYQKNIQEKQAERKILSRKIGDNKQVDNSAYIIESTKLRNEIEILTEQSNVCEEKIKNILDRLPNILDDTVPYGLDSSNNIEIHRVSLFKTFDFLPKEHFLLGENLGMLDFSTAAKMSGSRFAILRGPLARLERALGQFMIDYHTRKGFEEIIVPSLVNKNAMYGTGNLPKFEDDLFQTTDGKYLIPTAEIPLSNIVSGEILDEKELPIRLTALTDCFRIEAGSAGKDTRGIMRQHQFRKVELVTISHSEQSEYEHELITQSAENILRILELPFRRILLCSGDTGFSSKKTYDLEVWLPGQNMWREISSCSNCGEFQGRRMNARFRDKDGKINFVHTINGSGVAVGRALIAVMENYQTDNGSIKIPKALIPYMNGMEIIQKTDRQK